jgi:tRNA pseudouridine38-40 synthase
LSAEQPQIQRWAAGVEYFGSGFHGWQIQRAAPSVQGSLEAVLSSVADHPVATICAGRTDTGVHGFGQVVHFDSAAVRPARAWMLGANTRLAPDISLRWVQPVPAHFDARRSAVARRYRYLIHNHVARSALLDQRAAWVIWPLNAEAMHRAGQALIGELDFSAFRGADCQSLTPMRCVTDLSVRRNGDFVIVDIRANAFLHHMVRNIVGTLLEVGRGRQPEAWVGEVLRSRDRTRAGMNAPACGLYFVAAEYPAEFALPEPPEFWLP